MTYDESAWYRVRVTRPLMVGPVEYFPRDISKMRGRLVNRIVAEHGEAAIDFADRAD